MKLWIFLGSCFALCLFGCASGPKPALPSARPDILLLEKEIGAGLAERKIRPLFDQYHSYTSGRLDASAGTNTWRDKTGNCRLKWFDSMMRNQLRAPREAEQFGRQLHEAAQDESRGLRTAIMLAAEKVDLTPGTFVEDLSRDPASRVRVALENARRFSAAAFAPLTESERQDLAANLYPLSTKQIEGNGHSFRKRTDGRRLCDLMENMNRNAWCDAALALEPLADPDLLRRFATNFSPQQTNLTGVEGAIHQAIESPSGLIVVGGPGANTYDLAALTNVVMVIDPGGDDVYREGAVSRERPVLVIADLQGNDRYTGSQPGIQGGAVCGVSMLVDFAGNDAYEAQDVAQGACLAGVGILIDHAGDDSYRGLRRVQGSALGGIGILIDRVGKDRYHGAMYAQGVGGALGFGLLDDLDGDDHYYAGGKWKDGYDDSPGYDGWSQGVGTGSRGVANGGIGVLLDGGGDDLYECDYFSHGGGYWFAIGIARDFGGNDQRLGATRLAHDGSERVEQRFLRWGVGWQAHYGLGFLFDDAGDDTYGGNIVGLGFSWDVGLAGIFDLGGNDRYLLGEGGQGHQAGFGILFDKGGDDSYGGRGYGNAPSAITYHPLPDCGGNFAFSINLGGQDMYGGQALSNVVLECGSPGGFLIDRDVP